MTPFQVIWSSEALRQLAALWNAGHQCGSKSRVLSIAIDQALARNPNIRRDRSSPKDCGKSTILPCSSSMKSTTCIWPSA